ncbi:beta-ketoacyl synthase chain length factor [Simiduia sp. 21SJ11W-1]|uniref:beta-ketoacyl synthase chain length factor n=1 Tax=Simiduia sp. 21SJ11W-1 TaxID=2909669 RepID=UPI00209EF759|nr:beta-ketoacyl synthase chain length factor [Simiduia sp. 21SJ11W-1]UTA48713.1 beta-ketoacyl synthase chain length factor [Simiduia sp. 21SJ11W-1]
MAESAAEQAQGIAVAVSQWNAWLPGIQGVEACRQWAAGQLAPNNAEQPDVTAVPAMMRRRLNGVGRQVAAVSWDMIAEGSTEPMVFASRHGDQGRTLQLMGELNAGEPLSPAAFSMSVHNAVAGVLSIAKKARGPMTALAAHDQLVSSAVLEAWGQLMAGAASVLVVIYDQPLPEAYGASEPLPAYALTMRLRRAAHNEAMCLQGNWEQASCAPGLDDGLAWLRWLASDQPALTLEGELQRWHWKK